MDIKDLLEITLITCNRKEKLKRTLDQLLDDNCPIRDFDIKILDNASSDGTAELIEEYRQKHKNITHIINNRNIGGNGNIIKAFGSASKEYVWVICDDDFYHWEKWCDIEKAFQEDYDVIFVRKIERKLDDSINLGSVFCSSTFVPSAIYKTSKITCTVMCNMLNNVPNLFPHLALIAKNINDNSKIFYSSTNIVEIGPNTDGFTTYYRGLDVQDIPESYRKTYWTVGYYCSLELITDIKKRNEIIDNPVYPYHSLFQNFCLKIYLNKGIYKDYFYNYYKIIRILNLRQKLIFLAAYIKISLLCIFFDPSRSFLDTPQKHLDYVKHKNTKNHVNNLIRKYKNKKVLIYGAGLIADNLFSVYDFSKLNIIGVSDRKFIDNDPGTVYGYKTIKPDDIKNLDIDVILFTVMHTEKIKEDFDSKGIKIPTDCFVRKMFGFIF